MVMNKSQQQVWEILNTSDYVEHKQYREEHEWTWMTRDRDIKLIEHMDTDHIISCVNMLERAGQEYTRAYEGLCRELNYRINQKMKGV